MAACLRARAPSPSPGPRGPSERSDMKIVMFGAGGVGGYFGGRLAAGRAATSSFVARGAHLEAIRRDGLRIVSPKGDAHVRDVRASADPRGARRRRRRVPHREDVRRRRAAAAARPAASGPDTMVVTLQNGVEATDMVARHVGREPRRRRRRLRGRGDRRARRHPAHRARRADRRRARRRDVAAARWRCATRRPTRGLRVHRQPAHPPSTCGRSSPGLSVFSGMTGGHALAARRAARRPRADGDARTRRRRRRSPSAAPHGVAARRRR